MRSTGHGNTGAAAPTLQTSMTLWVALLTTALLAVAGVFHALHTPSPLRETGARLATAEELADIVGTALESHPFTAEPRPLEPGTPWTPPTRLPVVLMQRTLTACSDTDDAAEDGLSCVGEVLLRRPDDWFALADGPPRPLLRALPAAFAISQPLPAIRSRWLQLKQHADIHATFADGDPGIALYRSDWTAFYQAFPDTAGYVLVSSAVISADGGDALLVTDYRCGPMCFNGRVFWLKHRDHGWRLQTSKSIWRF